MQFISLVISNRRVLVLIPSPLHMPFSKTLLLIDGHWRKFSIYQIEYFGIVYA
jgi:hypothetical protein